MATIETETEFGGEDYRWWENQETLESVAKFLVDEKNATGKQILDFMSEPWHYTSYHDEWFEGGIAGVLEL